MEFKAVKLITENIDTNDIELGVEEFLSRTGCIKKELLEIDGKQVLGFDGRTSKIIFSSTACLYNNEEKYYFVPTIDELKDLLVGKSIESLKNFSFQTLYKIKDEKSFDEGEMPVKNTIVVETNDFTNSITDIKYVVE